MAHAHTPSLNRRVRGTTSLRLVTVSAAVGALALAGCSSGGDQSRPLTVQVQSTAAGTPTGAPGPSDTAADPAAGKAGSTAAPTRTAPAGVKQTGPASTTGRRAPVARSAHARPTGQDPAGTPWLLGAPTDSPAGATPGGPPAAGGSTGATTPPAAVPDLRTVVAAEGTALASATAVHVVGSVVIQGERYVVDLHLGADGEGTLTSPDGVVRVRRAGTKVFLNVDATFFALHKHPELADAYRGRWMPVDPDDPAYAVLARVTSVASWTALAAGAPATTATAGETMGSIPTVALSGGTGAKGTTVLVPAQGTVLPLLVRSTDQLDRITFDGWNAGGPTVQAPTALKEEPDDALVDVPAVATGTAAAFARLWVTTPAKGL